MKSKNFSIIWILIALFVAAWITNKSLFLRWFGYERYPIPVTDEFTYVWQGISLRKHGLPMAWTLNTGVYQDKKFEPKVGRVNGFGIEVEGQIMTGKKFKKSNEPLSAVKEIDYVKGLEQMTFVAPFFDHPPLGGIIYSLGEDKNIKEVEEIKVANFRQPALVMAIITTFLLFIFLTLVSNNPFVGTLGVMAYGTVPTYLLATRTAFLENVVPMLVLVNLITLFLWEKLSGKKYSILLLIISGFFSGLGVLAKEPGVGFLLGSLVLLWLNKKGIKNIFIFIFSAAVPILIYTGWGLWLQGGLFLDILLTNASRGYFGAIKVVTMMESLKFKDFPTDGWWIFGFLSLVILNIGNKNKNLRFLTIPLVVHILVVLLLGSANYPWYWISTIPFLAGCSAWFLGKIFRQPNLVNVLLFFFIPFSSSYYWGREALSILPDINHYRMALGAFLLMLFLRLKFKKYKMVKWAWMVFMAMMIYKIVIYNELFMPYLISHWGNLSIKSLPNY